MGKMLGIGMVLAAVVAVLMMVVRSRNEAMPGTLSSSGRMSGGEDAGALEGAGEG